MGITYGDHLIDSGYYDITPEQEREIEERKETEMADIPERVTPAGLRARADIQRGILDESCARHLKLAAAEIDRLQEAKRRALKLAVEHETKLNEVRAERDRMWKALQQIITVCGDNAGPKAKHDMALRFVRDVAKSVLTDEQGKRS